MSAIGKWLVGAILGWLTDWITQMWKDYQQRKAKEKERAEDNAAASEKLENADTEQEVIDAGSDLLTRH